MTAREFPSRCAAEKPVYDLTPLPEEMHLHHIL